MTAWFPSPSALHAAHLHHLQLISFHLGKMSPKYILNETNKTVCQVFPALCYRILLIPELISPRNGPSSFLNGMKAKVPSCCVFFA